MKIAAAMLVMAIAAGCGGSSSPTEELSCGEKVSQLAEAHYDRTGKAPDDADYYYFRQVSGCTEDH